MSKGIYCYIDKINNNIVYIGRDSSIHKNKRHKEHLQPSTYNRQVFNRILQDNLSRYQYQKLWEIDDCTDNHLNQMEIYYINKYNPKFNFTQGGDGTSGFKHSLETRKKMSESKKGKKPYEMTEKTRKKMSEARKGKTPWNKGKANVYSEETRKKMSESKKGKTHSLETRKKMSEAMKGKKPYEMTEKTRKKMSENNKGENNPMYGKKHSEETRKKMSENNSRYWRGKTLSKETRKKISKAKNITGFYRISKKKDNNCKQGFVWNYSYYDNNKRKTISSTDLKKLKKKIETQGLPWEIIDEEKAKKSLRENEVCT